MNIKNNRKILVVCHDAGGAEIVSSWVRRNPVYLYHFILGGSAIAIFENKLKKIECGEQTELIQFIETSDMVLTGTGWASNLEKNAVKLSKERQVKVVSFLDHWVNYYDRFMLNGELMMPDEIWVGDIYAMNLAKEIFCNTSIQLLENPYLMDIRDEIDLLSENQNGKNDCIRILYICEPIAIHARKTSGREDAFGYTEFEAMDLFVSHLHSLAQSGSHCKIQIRIRPHPSESLEKHANFAKKHADKFEITISHGNTLVDDCAWSNFVVGINSMALVVALAAGKKVFCCIPGQSRPIGLPHEGIHNFLELNSL